MSPFERDPRAAAVRRVVLQVLWLNLAVAAAKAVYGAWSGSLAVATDAIHSMLDASSNVVGLVALRLAAAPPDREHPYGHAKVEIVAAAAIGVAIAGGAFKFAWTAIEHLFHGGSTPHTPVIGFVIIGATWAVNVFVASFEARRGRELKSHFLLADAAHTASDVAVTAAVMASLAGARAGIDWADPVGALLVLVVIARVAWQILAANLTVLVDHAVVDADRVVSTAVGVAGVRGCHRVRSRGTSHAAHVDLHLLFDGDLPLRRAHEIAHEVEKALRAAFASVTDVTIHMEPEEDGDENL